jgi:uncharacterized NAD(P)/FAD-binding protein YdhS
MDSNLKRIAIVGAGPAGLFMYKKIVEARLMEFEVHLFEKKDKIGSGMPYSEEGARCEHVTNISESEMPPMDQTVGEWLKQVPDHVLSEYHFERKSFKEDHVLPRLLFGRYLEDQFAHLLAAGKRAHIKTFTHLRYSVEDIVHLPNTQQVRVVVADQETPLFDLVVICSGHNWKFTFEETVDGYFDSPYPPSKLNIRFNDPIAIRGTSLTAFDAIRTLARANGAFHRDEDGTVGYTLSEESEGFRLVLHSRNGMLPAIRFHLEDPLISTASIMTRKEVRAHVEQNDGFLSLDYMFERNFKNQFIHRDPKFHAFIKDMSVEEFVSAMMALRDRLPPIQLFKSEYAEAQKSFKRRQSIHWKEMLVVLSYALNYPAKYFSAEDMLRYQKTLAPLISIIIASAPQESCVELLALHQAGVLDILAVGENSVIEPKGPGDIVFKYVSEEGEQVEAHYKMFVDCIGQRQLSWRDLPFPSLVEDESVSPAYIRFRSPEQAEKLIEAGSQTVVKFPSGVYYLRVSGLAINDSFQVVDKYGIANNQIYMMAVPYIGGYNPDYSGLDFCEEASDQIIAKIVSLHLDDRQELREEKETLSRRDVC